MDGPAELFYDRGCGPCSFWAHAFEGLTRHRLALHPLDSPEADRRLGDLDPATRYGSMHVVAPDGLRSGADALEPILRWSLGPTLSQGLTRWSCSRRVIRGTYVVFWKYRRDHGCAAPPPRAPSPPPT